MKNAFDHAMNKNIPCLFAHKSQHGVKKKEKTGNFKEPLVDICNL